MERGCASSRVPGTATQLSPNPWICPPVGLAAAWWHPKAVGAARTGIWSHELSSRPLGMRKGHGSTGWALHHQHTPNPGTCHPTPALSCGVAGHTVAMVAAEVATLQLPIPSRPRCQLQLPHYYSAQSLPKQPVPLWWEQPEGRGTASGAGHRRPRGARLGQVPCAHHEPGTDPQRCPGRCLGHQAGAEPLGDARGTHVAPAHGPRSIPVPVPWLRCPAPGLHHGLLCVLETST